MKIKNALIKSLLLLVFTVRTLQAQTVKELFEGKVAVNLLLKDLNTIHKDLAENHPNLYWFVEKGTLNKKFDSLKNAINIPLTRMEFRYKVLTVLQCIGDGHLSLIMNANHIKTEDYESYVGNRISPVQQFDFKVIDSKLYVIGSDHNLLLPPGSEIVSMNGLPASDIIAKMIDGLCADGYNRTFKYFVLNSGAFSNIYSDTFGRQDSINFKIRDAAGEKSVIIRTISARKAIKPALYIPKMIPEQSIDRGVAILKISSFNNFIPQGHNYFFGNLKLKGVRTLILDLRNNTGGEQSIVTDLFSYLIGQPSYFATVPKKILEDPKQTPLESMKIGIQNKVVPNRNAFHGKLYVLLNGGSFSATAVLAANLQAIDSNVVIVGEESGGGSAGCTAGSFRNVALKNSSLSLRYGNIPIKSQIEAGTKGRGVIPDVLIKYSIDDYIAKRDLEMEWVRKNLPN